ncbi:MAG: hypothetical protein KF746_16310 [Chitinophagaceae bacterium]|nr:hypothetical protein [Chitinophagaceae bacterium]
MSENSIAQTPPTFQLSNEEIAKIKAEEILRKQIKEEISTPKEKENKILKFLNSPVGLLIISGIIISGIGKLITEGIDSKKAHALTKKEAVRYLTELNERVFQLKFFKAKLDTSSTEDFKKYYSTGFGATKLGATGWYNPVFSEFKEVPLQALIFWFKLNVKDSETADKSLKAIQTIIVNDKGILNSEEATECINKLEVFQTEIEKELKN